MKTIWTLGLAVLALSGCATGISITQYSNEPYSPESFVQCHGYSCQDKSPSGFTKTEWKSVLKAFKPTAKNAEAERRKIGVALARMEKIIGEKTGTKVDRGAAGHAREDRFQLDCIDETINTTRYIDMLQTAGVLRYHELAPTTHRGYFIDGRWPHNTAVIREKKTQHLYVVDSFYRPNGEEPYIVPRQAWLDGWKPPGATQ